MKDRRPLQPRLSPVLLAAGVVLVAINLRPAAAGIGPVLNRIQADTGLSSGWAGALTTLPVLCFGLLAPLSPLLARRLGVHTSIAVAMVALVAGMLLRLIPGVGFLFLGTAVAGAAIATGNVLVPVVVRRDFPNRTGTAMALYTTSLIGFAALAAGVTVPAANALGGGWRPGLAIWAIPAVAAAVGWLPALVRRDPRVDPRTDSGGGGAAGADSPAPGHTARTLLRHPLAWQVTLFFALQSGGFYATLAWLPSIFRSHGASDGHAGLLLSLSMIVGLATALAVPGLAARHRDHRLLVIVSCALTAAGLAGILVAPMSASYLWVVLLGLGQNATFPLALMMIVMRGGSVASTQGLSTLSQSVGYALAALAPLAVGAIHGVTGSWTPTLILLLALVVPQLIVGLGAGRDRRLAAAPQPGRRDAGHHAVAHGDAS
ncbi:MAG TPA: MFS transporter [Solirubrobacteraceae bacterium]|jgi:CP family cyanate transporter-like MFS transporter|nr:MFS transporter [Solirubrobacteraceae bacterium]